MGNKFDGGHRYGIQAEINLVPLTDVALSILVILIGMAPVLVRAQLKVHLPESHSGTTVQPEKDMLVVHVSAEGQAFLDGQAFAGAELEAVLRQRLSSRTNGTVIVEADRHCPLEPVVKVMDTARRAGAGRLALSVGRALSRHACSRSRR